MGIIQMSLVIVGEDFVGLFRGLEAHLSFCTVFFCDLVGVMC